MSLAVGETYGLKAARKVSVDPDGVEYLSTTIGHPTKFYPFGVGRLGA
jgi:hypothetical protein